MASLLIQKRSALSLSITIHLWNSNFAYSPFSHNLTVVWAFLRGMDQWIMEQRTRSKFQFSLQCNIKKHQFLWGENFGFVFPWNFFFAYIILFLNKQEAFRGFICTFILRNDDAGILLNTAEQLLQTALHFPISLSIFPKPFSFYHTGAALCTRDLQTIVWAPGIPTARGKSQGRKVKAQSLSSCTFSQNFAVLL